MSPPKPPSWRRSNSFWLDELLSSSPIVRPCSRRATLSFRVFDGAIDPVTENGSPRTSAGLGPRRQTFPADVAERREVPSGTAGSRAPQRRRACRREAATREGVVARRALRAWTAGGRADGPGGGSTDSTGRPPSVRAGAGGDERHLPAGERTACGACRARLPRRAGDPVDRGLRTELQLLVHPQRQGVSVAVSLPVADA